MPVIQNKTVNMGNSAVTEFVDTVGTTDTVFTFQDSNVRDYFKIENVGAQSLTVTIGGQSYTLQQGEAKEVNLSYSSFSVKSQDKTAALRVRASYFIYDETDEKAINVKFDNIPKPTNLQNYVRYGKIDLPSDFFNNISFRLYRDIDGIIKHNFDISTITSGYSVFYVSETGANGNNGTSEATPWQSLNYAIDTIEANVGVTSAKIIILSSYLSRTKAQINAKNLTKNYCIEAKTGTSILATSEPGLSWTLDGTAYKATRSSVGEVFDNKFKIEYGIPTKYTKVTSKDLCDTTKGSWYTDNVTVWVNTLDSRVPDVDVFSCLDVTPLNPIVNADVKVIFRNITVLNGCSASALNIYSLSNIGHLILDNVKLLSGSKSTENVLSVKGIKYTWSFNVLCAYGGRDGFNYHGYLTDQGINTFVFEYNCVSFDNGLTDTVNSNNNATTCHEGIRILRIKTVGYNTKGPLLADVNGCYSINYDCTMHDSRINTGYSTKVAYYFDDATSSLATAPNGKAILVNCQGGGDVDYVISGDANFKNGKISILNFIGQKIPSDLTLSYLS